MPLKWRRGDYRVLVRPVSGDIPDVLTRLRLFPSPVISRVKLYCSTSWPARFPLFGLHYKHLSHILRPFHVLCLLLRRNIYPNHGKRRVLLPQKCFQITLTLRAFVNSNNIWRSAQECINFNFWRIVCSCCLQSYFCDQEHNKKKCRESYMLAWWWVIRHVNTQYWQKTAGK